MQPEYPAHPQHLPQSEKQPYIIPTILLSPRCTKGDPFRYGFGRKYLPV